MASETKVEIGTKRHASGVLLVYADEWTLALSVEQERALLDTPAREAGAKEVVMNPRPGVSMRPVDGGPLITRNGARYLVIPMEGSDG